ncbi:transglutaminase family protein [Alteraurantiacibacter aestuarii]|uniref:Transglutaminase family protein n=1 Tax=Alteraurantiacibacter aestuarii TaxID=650004 RepID=A0A844ZKD3_9SPHN|nr:transglutaminase family protein [Alteraurantiacibacter aestuarii]MXO87973.1 transglutaminase family protein [Alteraurantiacibacter aestuarii]
MRLAINHTTHYVFDQPVKHALQRLRLTPKATQGQIIVDWTMSFEGAVLELEYDDQNFNHTSLISVLPGTQEVVVRCQGTVDTNDSAGVLGTHSGFLPLWSFLAQTKRTRPGPKLNALIAAVRRNDDDKLAMLHSLSAATIEAVKYEIGVTHVDTTAEQALADGGGVCQDHAQIFIGAARALGIPARYVSGYLMMNDRIQQEATHAWAEAHVEGLGWVGFDVSNGISPDERYVRVATGRDYRDAAPITGTSYGASTKDLTVDLSVEQQMVQQ